MTAKVVNRQFIQATALQVVLIVIISVLKLMSGSIARADGPALQAIEPVDASALPRARGQLFARPMVEVGSAVENVEGTGVRLILRVSTAGLSGERYPDHLSRYLVVDSEVGFTVDREGPVDVSKIRLSMTPYSRALPGVGFLEMDQDWSRRFAGNVAPVEFERETSVGIRERVQVSLVGVYYHMRFGIGRARDAEAYGIFQTSVQLLGYMYQNLEHSSGEEINQRGFNIADTTNSLGFGFTGGERWMFELILLNARNTAYVSGDGVGMNYEVGSEVRVRLIGDPDRASHIPGELERLRAAGHRGRPLEFAGYIRAGMRGVSSGAGNDLRQRARTVMAGLELRFY